MLSTSSMLVPMLVFTPDGTPWSADNGSIIKLVKSQNGDESDLVTFKRRGLPQSAKIKLVSKGAQMEVYYNGTSILKARDTSFPAGYLGLRVYGDPIKPSDASFSDLVFYWAKNVTSRQGKYS